MTCMNNQKESITILRLAGKTNNQFLIDKYEKIFEDDYFLDSYIKKENIESQWRGRAKELKISIKEFVQEIKSEDEDWVRERRMKYLEPIIKDLFSEMQELGSFIREYSEDGEIICGNKFKEVEKKYKRFFIEYASLRGDKRLESERITEDIIDRCREVPIEDLVNGKTIPDGSDRIRMLCPFHSEKTGSFFIFKNKNSFYCFGCNEGGLGAISFMMKLENMKFIEAVKYLKKMI